MDQIWLYPRDDVLDHLALERYGIIWHLSAGIAVDPVAVVEPPILSEMDAICYLAKRAVLPSSICRLVRVTREEAPVVGEGHMDIDSLFEKSSREQFRDVGEPACFCAEPGRACRGHLRRKCH